MACQQSSRLTCQEGRFTDCRASLGGGVYAEGGSHAFERCQFLRNTAYDPSASADGGGANFTQTASGSFLGCQFLDNVASDDGGGLSVSGTARVALTNKGAGLYLESACSVSVEGTVEFPMPVAPTPAQAFYRPNAAAAPSAL